MIELKGVKKAFGKQKVLKDVSMKVNDGEVVVILGPSGSGKTTFLNCLSGFIPKTERIVTIEDSAELNLQGIDNLVKMEARLPGPDGTGEVNIGMMIRASLRMRPDRIIVGEVRGKESADLLPRDDGTSYRHDNVRFESSLRRHPFPGIHGDKHRAPHNEEPRRKKIYR